MARLYVEASHLIRPFFERRGFHCVQTNQVRRGTVLLTNFTLEKPLSELSR
jgi:putative acetyltransferase